MTPQELLDDLDFRSPPRPLAAKKPKKPWHSACAERGLSTSGIDHVRACKGRHIRKSNLLPSHFLVCPTVGCTCFFSVRYLPSKKVPNQFLMSTVQFVQFWQVTRWPPHCGLNPPTSCRVPDWNRDYRGQHGTTLQNHAKPHSPSQITGKIPS